MKKIFKAAAWDASDFTESNVNNKTHWMIALLDAALSEMEIGTYSFQFSDASKVQLLTTNYGNFEIYHPISTALASSAYIVYANSITKELVGCASLTDTYSANKYSMTINTIEGVNAIKTSFKSATTSAQAARTIGGYLAIKFQNSEIAGTSSKDGICQANASTYITTLYTTVGNVAAGGFEALAAPVGSVNITYAQKPILRNYFDTAANPNANGFFGEYFESVYETVEYYLGAMANEDNSLFYYDGKFFAVDDATDITNV